jgi:hypothetical protein
MKIKTSIAAALVALASINASSASAQGNPPPPPKPMSGMESHHASSSGWKELDQFHDLLAATWHPVGKGDFKPVKEKAAKLAEAAKAWGESKVPAACDKKPVRDAVAASVVNARAVADLVAKQAPDSSLKGAMKKLHDSFEPAEHDCHVK